jgi:hypothetical protein
VVLDACRNNPFKKPGVRGVGAERGLGRIEPVRGVFTIYSAGIGQTALDRLSDADINPNSVFTRVFGLLRRDGRRARITSSTLTCVPARKLTSSPLGREVIAGSTSGSSSPMGMNRRSRTSISAKHGR